MEKIVIKGSRRIMDFEVPVVYGGFGVEQKCVSAKTVADIHNMQLKHVNALISRNKHRLKDNVDIIDIFPYAELRETVNELNLNGSNRTKHAYILSERGYMKLIKAMDNDLSWETMEIFINEYFRMQDMLSARNNEYISKAEFQAALGYMMEQEQKRFDMMVGFMQQVNLAMQTMSNIVAGTTFNPVTMELIENKPAAPEEKCGTMEETTINKVVQEKPAEAVKAVEPEVVCIPEKKTPVRKRVNSFATSSEYRAEAIDICKQIVETSKFPCVSSVLHFVCTFLAKKYGVNWENEMAKHQEMQRYYDKVSPLIIVSECPDNKLLKQLFMDTLLKILEKYVNEDNDVNVMDKSTETKKTLTVAHNFDEACILLSQIAIETNDKSPNAAISYNQIYKKMDEIAGHDIAWYSYAYTYKRRNNLPNSAKPTKKMIIGGSNKLQKFFVSAVNEMWKNLH